MLIERRLTTTVERYYQCTITALHFRFSLLVKPYRTRQVLLQEFDPNRFRAKVTVIKSQDDNSAQVRHCFKSEVKSILIFYSTAVTSEPIIKFNFALISIEVPGKLKCFSLKELLNELRLCSVLLQEV